VSDAEHQFWIAGRPPESRTSYAVTLPLDALFPLRIEAALRFWHVLSGKPDNKRAHGLPPQTRARHILILRSLDGRTDGASYRKIAETLLGFRGDKADWDSDPRKNVVRRLVADGLRYMRGGYRDLLHYPIQLPRHP
jgi:hypothetical protein